MTILTIDFETYYDKTYSLSKVTTEEYVRHELFEAIGVSVKIDNEPAQWFSGPKEATRKWLSQFAWGEATAVAHNAVFDMAILNWVFDIRPKRIVDTLSMARAKHGTSVSGSLKALAEHYKLGVKGNEVVNALGKGRLDFTSDELSRYAKYCVNDTELTYKLFECLAVDFPVAELRLIDLTIRMFTEPTLRVAYYPLAEHLSRIREDKVRLMEQINADREQLMSNPKFAEILIELGVVPPTKISPATGKETYAFAKNDEEFKVLLEHHDPQVQALVAARLGVKSTLEETRTERFMGISTRGLLPIPLRYYAAHTGRWGGDDKVNMQNLPRNSPLKDCILAPPNYLLIDSDSSQIEARTLAWLAGQNDLVEAFEKGEDVYKIMASSIYGVDRETVTKEQRFVGKTTILGAGYGMGPKKFRIQLKAMGVDLPQNECDRIIRVYRETYPKIPELWREAGEALEAIANNQTAPLGLDGVVQVEGYNGIRLPNGLYLKYPNLRWVFTDGKQEMIYDQKRGKALIPNRIYGGKLIENVCQALARIVIGEQMLMIARKYRVVMTVHDAVGCIVPTAEAERAQEFVEICMRIRPKWALGLPLNCESKIGASYGG